MSLLSRAKKALSKNEAKKPASKVAVAPKAKETQAKAPAQEVSDAETHSVQLDTLLTEKSLRAQQHDTVVFRVRPSVTKHQIAAAIIEGYGVTPKSIRTARFHAKMRRRGRTVGFTSPWKKAYVKVDDVSKFTAEE